MTTLYLCPLLLLLIAAPALSGSPRSFAQGSEEGAPAGVAGEGGFAVQPTQNAYRVPRYGILEIGFSLPERVTVEDPWFDLDIVVRFTGPEGETKTVGGFYYEGRTWRARFAPDQVGEWTYTYSLRTRRNASASGSGAFTCVPSDNPGFLRQNPSNPFLWVFENGDPFWPIGLQDCIGDGNSNGTILDTFSLEGGDRNGPWVASPSDIDTYLRTYAQGGFSLFRFSQQNCSYALYNDLDHYLAEQSRWTDELLQKLQYHRYRILYGFFGYANAFTEEPGNAAAMAKVKRFLKYSVDRWGAYVDIWELLNEQTAADEWTTMMAEYVRSIDPYHHPVTTSWEHPELKPIEINAPHWYELENWWDSDSLTARNAQEWKRFGKPVIVGEQGNRAGATWDYTSALRMRIRTWTALFSEISFVFWNTSYAPNGHHMNIYLGAQERQYLRALANFATHLDAGMKSVPVATSDPEQFRAYGLASGRQAAVYLCNNRGQSVPAQASISLDVPGPGRGYWIRPSDSALVSSFPVGAGRQTIPLPKFEQDLALLITDRAPAAPPLPVVTANPQFGLASEPVVLDGRKSAGAFGQRLASYHWSFGDGATAEGPVVAHTYPYGSYLTTLTVTDASGAQATAGLVIRAASSQVANPQEYADLPEIAGELERIKDATAINRAPTTSATAAPASGPAPLGVWFHGEGADGDGLVVSYLWDFGDGGKATTLDAQHLYTKPGVYVATLKVTDDHQAVGRASVTVTVTQPGKE